MSAILRASSLPTNEIFFFWDSLNRWTASAILYFAPLCISSLVSDRISFCLSAKEIEDARLCSCLCVSLSSRQKFLWFMGGIMITTQKALKSKTALATHIHRPGDPSVFLAWVTALASQAAARHSSSSGMRLLTVSLHWNRAGRTA